MSPFQVGVDTLKFLLFLFLQQLNRMSLRTSLIGEEWPGPRSPSPCSEREATNSSRSKVIRETPRQTCVSTRPVGPTPITLISETRQTRLSS